MRSQQGPHVTVKFQIGVLSLDEAVIQAQSMIKSNYPELLMRYLISFKIESGTVSSGQTLTMTFLSPEDSKSEHNATLFPAYESNYKDKIILGE